MSHPSPVELTEALQALQDAYFEQPVFLRRRDLAKINELRALLGFVQVDADLRAIVAPSPPILPTPPAPRKKIDKNQASLLEAERLYLLYLDKEASLRPYREYCRWLVMATKTKGGMTPIEPLALGGRSPGASSAGGPSSGRPLLCDVCEQQIPLEGGPFNGIGAGDAWARGAGQIQGTHGDGKPRGQLGYSYILHGLALVMMNNGTIRVYHGYQNQSCWAKAEALEASKAKEFATRIKESGAGISYDVQEALHKLLIRDLVFEAAERRALINRIRASLFTYDPGVGINGP